MKHDANFPAPTPIFRSQRQDTAQAPAQDAQTGTRLTGRLHLDTGSDTRA